MRFRKAIGVMNGLLDALLLIGCLALFVAGAYAMYDERLVYDSANDESLLRFKPGYEADAPTDAEKKIQGNMVAWLTIDGTSIDYPVMQGENNSEYLNKNPYGEYSLSGSIFLDSRNDSDFKDEYSLIYGHHMERGAMFGALDEYLEEGYMEKFGKGSLTSDGNRMGLRIFAVLEAPATESAVFAPTENDGETLPYLRRKAKFIKESDWPKDGERILALSTCKYPDTAERTIVFAVIEDASPTEEGD